MIRGTIVFFYKIAHPFVSWLRSRPLVLKSLFFIRVPPDIAVQYDTTTVLFRKALMKEIQPGAAVLEMGIGQAALLSLYLARKKNIRPHGVDVSDFRVKASIATAEFNGIEVDFRQSDLFSNVQGTYDVVFFNPPYVHTSSGQSLGLTKRLRLESDAPWDGGSSGTDVLKKFIQDSPPFLTSDGKLMVGVQDFYVSKPVMVELTSRSNYYIYNIVESLFNPSRIYVLKKKIS